MIAVPSNLDSLVEKVIGCAIAVHRALGPGLLESVYRDSLVLELRDAGLRVDVERRLPVTYKGQTVGDPLKIDVLVDGVIVVEVKAVDQTNPVFLAQVITYLKLTGCPAGLLMNFNTTALKLGLRRLQHPDIYVAKGAKREAPKRIPSGAPELL